MVSKPSARIVAGLTLVVALAAALRWHQIAAMPLWLDEVISQHRAHLPFEALVADSLANMHLPTYFLLLVLVALLAAAAAPIVTLAAASAFAPVFAPRYLAAGAPAFLVLAATGAV